MAVEVIVLVENRQVALDIEQPADLKSFKKEFDEWCEDDEAMQLRRQVYAPIFSMSSGSNTKREIKRKYVFQGGEEIHVNWTPLKLETSNEDAAISTQDPKSLSVEGSSALESKDNDGTGSSALARAASSYMSSPTSSLTIDDDANGSDGNESDGTDGSDYSDHGVKEYYTEEIWKKLPKFLKLREKLRYDNHEALNRIRVLNGEDMQPFQPHESPSEKTQGGEKRKRLNDENVDGKELKQRFNRDSQIGRRALRTLPQIEPSKRPACSQSNPEPGPSSQGGGFFSCEEVENMKPELPKYDVLEILDVKYAEGNDELKARLDKLKDKGILFSKDRAFLVRLLTRHLFFQIAKSPKDVSADMREGLAKSIVVNFPKFQNMADGKTSFPWDSFYSRGVGRGWIANSARSVQSKYRTRKSRPKSKTPSVVVRNPDDPSEILADQTVKSLALLMPGRAEKEEIIKGMKSTFHLRQDARKKQVLLSEMLLTYPHLASYEGEILQVEFRLLHPSGHDMSKKFQDYLQGILALPASDIQVPIEEDALKALLKLAQNLPKDIRTKGDPKDKNPKANLKDIVEVIQLGQDIDSFICDKVAAANGQPIQPYLILVQSPITKKVSRFFLVLDYKPMQIASGSIFKALDILLKSYFVFHVRYPLGWRSTFHCLATCFANTFEKGLRRPDAISPSEHELFNRIKAFMCT